MTKLSALIAAVLIAAGPAALAQPLPQKIAQGTPTESSTSESSTSESSDAEPDIPEPGVTQFLSDNAPAECSLQVTAVTLEESNQPTADILATVPLLPCDAVSGTDDGNSRNFNFLNLSSSNFYKIITSSAPVADAEDETYQFSVQGVKVVPIDEAGNAASLETVEYLFPSDDQVCTADAVEQPRSVTCNFEVKAANTVLIGQLKYVW